MTASPGLLARKFNPLTLVTPLHAMWASDPLWANPGDGGLVSSWRNQSGGGDPLAALGNRPTFRTVGINGRPSIEFDGLLNFLRYDIADIAQPLQILVVAKFAAAPTTVQRIVNRGSTGGASHAQGFGSNAPGAWQNAWPTSTTGGTVDANPHVIHCTLNGASSTLIVDSTTVISSSPGTGGPLQIVIGAGWDNTVSTALNFFAGLIAYVGYFSSGSDLTALKAGLRSFYAI